MTQERKTKVRFAPSPTGYLHLGSARTALFNWLFAESTGGTLILRIEDTDKKRSKKAYLNEILESLKWLGIVWDGRPYLQSKRNKIYAGYAKELLKNETAYSKGKAIFFKMPKEMIQMNDLAHGNIEFDGSLQEDIVIIKSDGNATYNFACVVDDIEMGITHVIRGDDHISNTPKQLALYRALGATPPIFAHIPLIMGEDRSRLSKRHGATSIAEYKERGYLSPSMFNFLALLGWSPGDNREIMSRDEIVKAFSLERIVKTSSIFDNDKLNWINNQHIKTMDINDLIGLLKPYMKRCGYLRKKIDRTKLKNIVRLYRTRMKTLSEFCYLTEYLFKSKVAYDRETVKKFLRRKELKVIFGLLVGDLAQVRSFDPERIEKCCRDLIARLGIRSGDLIHPVRAAVTGRSVSPGLFEVMSLLGKDTTIQRLKFVLKKYCK